MSSVRWPNLRSPSPTRSQLLVTVFAFSVVLAHAQIADPVHIEPMKLPPAIASATPSMPTLTSRMPAMKVNVDLVLVPVSVVDSDNHPVLGLRQPNFKLLEDKKPQQIQYFASEDAPISVGIILDLSGTMDDKMDKVRQALDDFFQNAHPEDDYFVITFAERPKILADTTKSQHDIQAKLAFVKPDGMTALLDAIYMGLDKLQTARYKRRALVIVSDGIDNFSRYTLNEVKRNIEESDVSIYAIGLFDDKVPMVRAVQATFGRRLLNKVTHASGGRMISVMNSAKLPAAAATISRELRNQYVLGYRPDKKVAKNKYRKIKVQVRASEDGRGQKLDAFYRKGYSAPE